VTVCQPSGVNLSDMSVSFIFFAERATTFLQKLMPVVIDQTNGNNND